MAQKVFVDTNIIVDFLMKREPFDIPAALLFNKADLGEIEACVSASVFPFLFYLLTKSLRSKKDAWQTFNKFRLLVSPLPVDAKVVDLSLASDFKDLEDAMQYQIALQNNVSVFLTRNLKDFEKSAIPVMTAETFLKSK
ncbi:MAG: PIN domain-containing protein [Saprospiraceae bacterium]